MTAAAAASLDTEVTLRSWTDLSGPDPDDDPFARDELDLGFICAPSYLALASRAPASVRLAGAAPVFADPRNGGRPVYFSELVVIGRPDATSLEDLAAARIGINDRNSMSGLVALLEQMRARNLGDDFATLVLTGGHRHSLDRLVRGDIDAAAIDSNTLLDVGGPPDGTRVLETWGPYPVQPVVVRASMVDTAREVIANTLLSLHHDRHTARALRRFGVERFAVVTEADYR
ncbi:MAG TPA: PhnD/SsuA/transferrin family substrate-binding protein [Acidimicrobiales bacterium]|nr:PhnD/SsuA/transferrin family substrate-binding protein [Acidimicrobiales bacterium]